MSRSAASLGLAALAAAILIAQAPLPASARTLDAHGQLVASSYHARLSQFACTGASFSNGISTPRVNYGYLYNTTLRPPEGRLLAGRVELAGLSALYVPPRPAGWHWTAVAG